MSKCLCKRLLINLYRNIVKVKQIEMFQSSNKSGSSHYRMNRGSKVTQDLATKSSAFGFKNSHQTEIEVCLNKL